MEYTDLAERKQNSEKIFGGKLLNLYNDTVLLPDGNLATREYIRHVGAVCVVAITDNGCVLVERQYRYPIGRVTLEIPAGKLDSPEEDHEKAARRELLEETGVEAGELRYLGEFYPTAAYSDEKIYMYLAKKLTFGSPKLDEDEFLTVDLVPLDELVKEILQGNIPDGKTQAAILRAYLMENHEK